MASLVATAQTGAAQHEDLRSKLDGLLRDADAYGKIREALDDAGDNRQAESRALTLRLGGKEWLEELCLDVVGHTRPVIDDVDPDHGRGMVFAACTIFAVCTG